MHYGTVTSLLVALQMFQVIFLFTHDFIPLGSLNDVSAQRRTDSRSKRVRVTLFSGLPYVLLLLTSLDNASVRPLPAALLFWLWVGYGLLLLGELRVWLDSLHLTPGSCTSGTLQGAIRENTCVSQGTQWYPPQYL